MPPKRTVLTLQLKYRILQEEIDWNDLSRFGMNLNIFIVNSLHEYFDFVDQCTDTS